MSETKSAGVPAGATHVCTVEGCGIYYRQIAPGMYEEVPRVWEAGLRCAHSVKLLQPIAEAGPAPAERVGDSREDPDFYEGIDFAKPAPAEQPGKAADPRPAQQTAREQRAKKLADQVVEQERYYNGLARIPLEELLFKALTEEAAQPSEGQTAQEMGIPVEYMDPPATTKKEG